MATEYANGKIVTNGLVLSLDAADRNSYVSGSTVWNDVSGNGNSGSLTNGPTFNSGSGGNIVFDGTNDYVDFGNPASLNISTSLTLESWVYITNITTGAAKTIIARWGSAQRSYKLAALVSSKNFYIDISDTGNNDIYRLSSTIITINRWYHVVGVYTSGGSPTLNVYVNGVLDNSTLVGTLPSSIYSGTSTLNIGTDVVVSGNYYQGNISNSKIYNRTLSAAEVLQNYNAQKSRFGL
jgi:hypothetical protein